jgi:hypothetical protein
MARGAMSQGQIEPASQRTREADPASLSAVLKQDRAQILQPHPALLKTAPILGDILN